MSDYFIFGDIDTRNYEGIYVYFDDVDATPSRVGEFIEIPGRNGSFYLDKGRYEDVTHTYDIVALTMEAGRNLINAISSQVGYHRLEDSFNPDEFYSAVFTSEVEPNVPTDREQMTFKLMFTRKPQRFLTSGETAITIGEWRDTETVSGDIVEVENPDGILGVKSLSVALSPIQDLNGYDKPWSGGNGKNKLKPRTLAQLKSLNTVGTWNGNVYTAHDITVTCIENNGVIEEFRFNGTASANTTFYVSRMDVTPFAGMILNGMPTGSAGKYEMGFSLQVSPYTGWAYDTGSGATIIASASGMSVLFILVKNGKDASGLVVKPMIRLATETDATFAPYSNICPISGRTEVVTQRTGFNAWDEEWELGDISSVNGTNIASSVLIRSKNYIPLIENATYYCKAPSNLGNLKARFYDADKNYIGSAPRDSSLMYVNATFVPPANARYLRIATQTTYGTTYNNDISINYPSTDHEYHAYNGTSYTTALGQTVYGGTLDVVSGVLTVDRAMVDLGSLTWTKSSSTSGGFYATSQFNYRWASDTKMLCSRYKFDGVRTSSPYFGDNGTLTCFMATGQHIYEIYIKDESLADKTASEFKTAMDGVQLVYELATPQTYQLSPQEVALLTGTNNVWSDSGDITLEYGQLPNVLVNPTLFEASPLLEIEGYGTLNVNGTEIEIADELVGDVDVESGMRYHSGDFTISFDEIYINTGDLIEITNLVAVLKYSKTQGSQSNYTTGGTVTSYSGDTSTSPAISDRGRTMTITFNSPLSFYYGTPSTKRVDFTVLMSWHSGGNSSHSFFYIVDYDGEKSLRFRGTPGFASLGYVYSLGNVNQITADAITIHSTATAFGHPTYIDCDLGEAYAVNDGVISSLNSYIALGSKLPILSVGENEITFDNTITDLKVTPRLWKV